ncbi:MAG: 3-oxoacyl-ACP synthase [Actinobacteria bacterium]|nr:3-oxoacyl-ACP synthase [Actinomycetota bacterium]
MRFYERLSVVAAETWLPATVETVTEAVARGALPEAESERVGVESLPVATEAPPELAVHAGRLALSRGARPAASIGLVVHSWLHYQGHDMWSPAHFVAAQLGLDRAEAFGVFQMSNGGAAAIQVAAARLLADPSPVRALVTTGDRFGDEGFDRWRGDYGLCYGDGGTAVLLERTDDAGDLARDGDLLAVGMATAPRLEVVHRGGDPFQPAARTLSPRVDFRRPIRGYLERCGDAELATISRAKVAEAVRVALADAGLDERDDRITLVIPPRMNPRVLDEVYRPVLAAMLPQATLVDGGTRTGHLGAGDVPAGIADLCSGAMLAPGEIGAVVGVGGGFSWSCAVFRSV